MKRPLTEMVFMLLLMLLFVGCSFVTIERCASFYQSMLREQQADDQVQLPYLVLFNRLQNVPADQVTVREWAGTECLVIQEEIEGRTYETLFYYQNGALMELLTGTEHELNLTAGEILVSSQPLSFELESDRLQVRWQNDQGPSATLSLILKGGAE